MELSRFGDEVKDPYYACIVAFINFNNYILTWWRPTCPLYDLLESENNWSMSYHLVRSGLWNSYVCMFTFRDLLCKMVILCVWVSDSQVHVYEFWYRSAYFHFWSFYRVNGVLVGHLSALAPINGGKWVIKLWISLIRFILWGNVATMCLRFS